MVTRDVVVQLLPEFLDVVNPRLIGGLEQNLEFGMVPEPGF